jgi:hypothetical protein
MAVVNIGANSQSTALSNITITVPAGGVPAGSLIVVGIVDQTTLGGSGISSPSDSSGNSYGSIVNASGQGTDINTSAAIYYSFNCLALNPGDTIEVDPNGSIAGGIAISAFYWTSAQTSSDPIDGGGSNSNAGSTTPSGTGIHPFTNGDLVVGFVATRGPSTDTFTQDSTDGAYATPPVRVGTTAATGPTLAGGTFIQSVAAATDYKPTLGTSRPWIDMTGAFLAGSAPIFASYNGEFPSFENAKLLRPSTDFSGPPPIGAGPYEMALPSFDKSPPLAKISTWDQFPFSVVPPIVSHIGPFSDFDPSVRLSLRPPGFVDVQTAPANPALVGLRVMEAMNARDIKKQPPAAFLENALPSTAPSHKMAFQSFEYPVVLRRPQEYHQFPKPTQTVFVQPPVLTDGFFIQQLRRIPAIESWVYSPGLLIVPPPPPPPPPIPVANKILPLSGAASGPFTLAQANIYNPMYIGDTAAVLLSTGGGTLNNIGLSMVFTKPDGTTLTLVYPRAYIGTAVLSTTGGLFTAGSYVVGVVTFDQAGVWSVGTPPGSTVTFLVNLPRKVP